MDLSALRGKRLGAAVVFVAATLVLAVQLITPTPVVVSVGENGARTTQLGQYFTYSDVAVVAVAASFVGASGTYLLLPDHSAGTTTGSETSRTTGDGVQGPPTGRSPDRAMGDGDGGGAVPHRDAGRQGSWEETLDRLRNNEETVYAEVLDAGGELPQRDIVEGTDLSKATVSRTLDILEGKGLVERKRRGMGNVVVLQ